MSPPRSSRTDALLERLRAENIETWFDLGLMLDRLRDERAVPSASAPAGFSDFRRKLARGVAFVTYYCAVDGVTMEIAKYAEAMRSLLPDPRIHFVGAQFGTGADSILGPEAQRHVIPEIDGFDRHSVYQRLFQHRLDRGSPLYNRLIADFWQSTLKLVATLGRLFDDEEIQLIFAVNTNSNPGNPPLALALVLLSEHLGIPVISNNHDFYWEGGCSEIERESLGQPKGPRDHFFTNAHLGEVFSVIEMTHPWRARSWLSLNLNDAQCDALVSKFGHSPASVAKIGTTVDLGRFHPLSRPRRTEVLQQIAALLGKGGLRVPVRSVAAEVERGIVGDPRPVLLGARSGRHVAFMQDNMIFLQPTRIIARKHIARDFDLIAALCQDPEFAAALDATPSLKITVVVTGPVAGGHEGYFEELLHLFEQALEVVPERLRERVFLAPLFAGIDSPEFRARYERPAEIADLYAIASLVCLPSETEGRGLPILEAAAAGVPILVRRYQPEAVYAELIGEDLAADQRLEVIEIRGSRVGPEAVAWARDVLLHPHHHAECRTHNRHVVDIRYGPGALEDDMRGALGQLHAQLQSNEAAEQRATQALARFRQRELRGARDLVDLVDTRRREYLAGTGRMGFMLMLKSLIDPSYFRVEEQRIQGLAFAFACRLVDGPAGLVPSDVTGRRAFFHAVESLFLHWKSEMPVMFDHALAYRHRNRRDHPYHRFTPEQLTGVINELHREVAEPDSPRIVPRAAHHFSNWGRALEMLCGGPPAIDQRARLRTRLAEDVPFAFFPGTELELELELFVLEAVRSRLGLGAHEFLTAERLTRSDLSPIHVILRERPCADLPTNETLQQLLTESTNEEIALVFESGAARVVRSRQLGIGIDVCQLGKRVLDTLREVRAGGGFLLAAEEQAAATTDILDLDRFHVGRAMHPLGAHLMGVEPGEGYVQWVPAGLRFALAYPTPVQTGRDLAELLEGSRFRELCAKRGEADVLEVLRRDAAERGSPVGHVLAELRDGGSRPRAESVIRQSVNGIYADGHPWSGSLARVAEGPLRYRIVSSPDNPRTMLDLVHRFERRSGERARIAWNGGYILNAELVGKLGLPESYIGSPLGMIVEDGRVLCPPLYAKPAFLVHASGALEIRRVGCGGGLEVALGATELKLPTEVHNPQQAPADQPCYYDLLFSDDTLRGDGRTLVRLAGTRIMEVAETAPGERVPVWPVGLVLSFPPGRLPAGFAQGAELELHLPAFSGVAQAVEAGPLLIENGELCIDMETEGWKTQNSIRTQAARLDYLDMRGPKIAAGLDSEGRLSVLTVNGRIRESVGATHTDMAEILRDHGMVAAMGFDPGGSATLVVGRKVANISPYNADYERDVWSLPPQPRAVSSGVIGY
ncbi:MAG: glycosyltransferase [bacterium]|nr:glycosyltransferase [bacterium]